jgi:acyl-CoA thioester hydrolase
MQAGRRGKNTATIPDHCLTETLQRIGVAETDMMGIVHHANYVVYLEMGRLEYMRRRGFSYKALVERGYHMPVIELEMRYRKPAYFDDLLRVTTKLGALTRVTARFDYSVTCARAQPEPEQPASELLLEARVLLACVDAKKRPRQLPDDIVQALCLPEASRRGDRLTPDSPADRAGSV